MDQPKLTGAGGECPAGELRPVVAEHSCEGDAVLAQRLLQVVEERGRDGGGLVADDQLDQRDPGRDVDRGELPDRADALESADVEGVQRDDLTRRGGEQAEPECGPPWPAR